MYVFIWYVHNSVSQSVWQSQWSELNHPHTYFEFLNVNNNVVVKIIKYNRNKFAHKQIITLILLLYNHLIICTCNYLFNLCLVLIVQCSVHQNILRLVNLFQPLILSRNRSIKYYRIFKKSRNLALIWFVMTDSTWLKIFYFEFAFSCIWNNGSMPSVHDKEQSQLLLLIDVIFPITTWIFNRLT